ncbi:alpha/beta hydrolase [Rhizobium sp. WW_1]|uniref:alpha/beta hydrolase fold domain-containing protein n=2 Tax=unclassified Rhizobium TaxID=2613769 RepID=UPI001FDF9A36|nr:alpha/beta hydrolase [Rhizobium sp. WW_1]
MQLRHGQVRLRSASCESAPSNDPASSKYQWLVMPPCRLPPRRFTQRHRIGQRRILSLGSSVLAVHGRSSSTSPSSANRSATMVSRQSLANKAHYEILAEAWRSGRELPPEVSEWSVLTAEPGGVDYVEANLGDKTALWVRPKLAAEDRVMLYLHGGGYVGGSIWTHRKMVGHIAKAIGCYALLATYDYSFQSKFPRQIEQAVTAFEWLAEQGIRPEQIIGAGDSAGAGLIIAAAMKLRDIGRPLPAAILSISGWHDLSASGLSYEANREKDVFFQKATVDMLASQVLAGADPRHPFASPIFADLKGLPPIYLQAGEDETLLDDSRALADRAKADGLEVRLDVFPGMLHSFQMMAGRAPEADEAIERFAQWVRPKLGLTGTTATRGEGQEVA